MQDKFTDEVLAQRLLSTSISGSFILFSPNRRELIHPFRGLSFDILAPKPGLRVDLGFSGDKGFAVKSKKYSLSPGWNQIYVNFARDFRRGRIDELDVMRQIIVSVQDGSPLGSTTEVYMDNMQLHRKRDDTTNYLDGHGFENGRTCVYRGSVADGGDLVMTNPVQEPGPGGFKYCSDPYFDQMGDGWGFENMEGCIVRGSQADQDMGGSAASDTRFIYDKDQIPVCRSPAADPDGDGMGWENDGSCRIP